MHRIAVVCRQNAARSVLISAALKRQFPLTEIISCGVEALTGNAYPQITLQTAMDWGLTLTENHSINIKDLIGGLRHNDKVIVVEDYMKQSPYLASVDPLNVYSFGDLNLVELQLPVDPVGFDLQNFKVEVAKAVFCASNLVAKFFDLVETNANLRLFLTYKNFEESMRKAIDYCANSSTSLLVANFITIPEVFSEPHFKTCFLRIGKNGEFFAPNVKRTTQEIFTIFQTQFESNYSSKLVLGAEFNESVARLCNDGPLLVLCQVEHPMPRMMEMQWLIASQVVLKSLTMEVMDVG